MSCSGRGVASCCLAAELSGKHRHPATIEAPRSSCGRPTANRHHCLGAAVHLISDRLRQIDGHDADGLTLSALQRALAGKSGDTKTLVIERAGQRLTVKAVVARIL